MPEIWTVVTTGFRYLHILSFNIKYVIKYPQIVF